MESDLIIDKVKIGENLVLISENRISFIPGIGNNQIDVAVKNELAEIIKEREEGEDVLEFNPSIAFMPTFNCNLRCVYCYAKGGENKKKLSSSTAEHVINWLAAKTANASETVLTMYFVGGGEPFMNFGLMKKIVAYARLFFSEVDIILISNGVYTGKEINWLINNRVSVRISYDGVMQKENRPGHNFNSEPVVTETIRILSLAKIPMTVQLTVTREGTEKLIDSIERIVSLGGFYIKVEPVHDSVLTRGDESLVPELEEFVGKFGNMLEWIAINNITVKIDNSFISRPNTGYYCGAGEGGNITVTPHGLITSCLEVARQSDAYADKMIYGRVASDGQVIFDSTKRKFLDQLHWQNFSDCPYCNLKLICGGGCPMHNGWENGDLFIPSPYNCQAHKLLLPKIFELIFKYPQIVDVVFDGHSVKSC